MIGALKVEAISSLDKTCSDILKVIVKHFNGEYSGFIRYTLIANELGIDRDTVRKAVNRMIENGTVKVVNGKLFIPSLIYVNSEKAN